MEDYNFITALDIFKEDEDVKDLLNKKSEILEIPDNFEYNNPELIRLLEEKIEV
jgi:predicted protein tyrosine phosphatase